MSIVNSYKTRWHWHMCVNPFEAVSTFFSLLIFPFYQCNRCHLLLSQALYWIRNDCRCFRTDENRRFSFYFSRRMCEFLRHNDARLFLFSCCNKHINAIANRRNNNKRYETSIYVIRNCGIWSVHSVSNSNESINKSKRIFCYSNSLNSDLLLAWRNTFLVSNESTLLSAKK